MSPIHFVIIIFTVQIISVVAITTTATVSNGNGHTPDERLVPTMPCTSRRMMERDGSELREAVGKFTWLTTVNGNRVIAETKTATC